MIIKENERMKNLYYSLKIRDNVANTLKEKKPESKETTYTNHIPKSGPEMWAWTREAKGKMGSEGAGVKS